MATEWLYINWTITENHIDTVTVAIINKTDTADTTINYTEYQEKTEEYNTSLPDGTYQFNVSINDSAGNIGTTELRNVTIDTTIPTIAFDAQTPSNNSYLATEWLYINWTITENNIDTITVSIINRTDTTNQAINTTEYTILNEEYNISLPGGAYQYNITINDTAGNTGESSLQNITIDTTNPTINFDTQTPDNNTVSTDATLYFNWTITEDHIDTITVAVVNNTDVINHTEYQGTVPLDYNTTITGGEGAYHYNVSVNDTAGNTATTTLRTYRLDTASPTISFDSQTPENNSYLATEWLYINWTITEANIDTITVTVINRTGTANQAINTTEYTTLIEEYNLSLVDGTYQYNISVNDSVGNLGVTGLRNVTIDTIAPTIAFESQTPSNGTTNNDYFLYFNWTINENNIDTITVAVTNTTDVINHTEYTGTLTLEYNTSLPGGDGTYTYNVSINDSAGSSSTETLRTYILDTSSPTITFASQAPANNSYTATEWLYINWTINENNIDTISVAIINKTDTANGETINYTEYRVLTEEYNTSLPQGTYQYNITINDTNGNIATTELRNTTLDTTNPTISFDTQTQDDNSYHSSPTLYINWTITENNIDTITYSIYNTTNLYNCTELRGELIQEANLTTPDDTYTYNVSINDTAGT